MKLDNVILETYRDGQELATNVWGTNLISRTINEDPLSLNLYTYCHNNPIEYYDPTGHIAWHVIGAGINLVADYLDDGKINRGAKSYLKAAGVGALVGATLGYGYGAYVMNAGLNAGSMIAGMTAFGMADSAIGDIIYNDGDIDVPKAISEGVKYGAAEAGSQVFQYGMEKIVIKLISAVEPNPRNMFGGLKMQLQKYQAVYLAVMHLRDQKYQNSK